jgi:transcriptional regulator with XRE-family HTH domain
MPKNWELLRAIEAAGYTQRSLAEFVGMHESEMSKIVNGRLLPRDDEKQRIANVLGKKVREVFEE